MKRRRAKKNSKSVKILTNIVKVLFIVLAMVVATIFYKYIWNNANLEYQEQEMDETAVEYKKNPVNNDGKNVIMPGWGKISIKANTTNITSGVDFYNPKENEGYYYLKFQLIVDDEVLYESGLVAPDKHIQNITLKKPLEAGKYDAVVFIQPYKWDRKTPTNNGQVRVDLEVSS